ncbi:MAG: LptE family protein [Bacteroidetes bacterium]|nr:LptE family protein [Bacteroidota bacterium]
MKRAALILFSVAAMVLLFNSSCTVKLTGATIPDELKTINIEYFENNSPLVVNYLSQQFTETLKDRIRSSTSLSIVQGESDARMSGNITNYTIEPVSIQATNNNVAPIAGAERLTITVNVTYSNNADKHLNFSQSFSEHQDFTGDIANKEQSLITAINKQLVDDIFNRAFENW